MKAVRQCLLDSNTARIWGPWPGLRKSRADLDFSSFSYFLRKQALVFN